MTNFGGANQPAALDRPAEPFVPTVLLRWIDRPAALHSRLEDDVLGYPGFQE